MDRNKNKVIKVFKYRKIISKIIVLNMEELYTFQIKVIIKQLLNKINF